MTILWDLVPRPDHFEPPGPQLTPESEPQLFALIEDVAAATSQQRPSEVYLLNEVSAWVSQRGGFMGFGSKRVMGVGLPLMTNMTRPELRAVIAHEFGHFRRCWHRALDHESSKHRAPSAGMHVVQFRLRARIAVEFTIRIPRANFISV